MKPKERMAAVFAGEKPDRIPFVPTIYEHAAALLGKTPSQLARDEKLLVEGHLKAYETYGHDYVVVGMDIYNVQAEALGCSIVYYDDSTDIPGIVDNVLGDDPKQILKLRVPDPEKDGRMPMIISASTVVKEKIGDEVAVAAAIVGPFTLAAQLRGFEKLSIDMIKKPDYARELFEFASQVTYVYGAALAKEGIGLALNDSWISQPLLSPKLYREFVFPLHKRLVNDFKDKWLSNVSVISGGNTTEIAGMLVETGSSIILVDSNSDLDYYKKIASPKGVVLRGTLDPKLLERGSYDEIRESSLNVLRNGAPGGYFIMGCGVASYHTEPERIKYLKSIVEEFTNF